MCLQIPLLVKEVVGRKVVLENGRVLINKTGKTSKSGDYVYVFGDLVVDVLSSRDARCILEMYQYVTKRSA